MIVGCQKSEEKSADVDIENKGDSTKVTVESEDGKQTIDVKTANEDEWCNVGSEVTTAGPSGSSVLKVVGIETSGKYEGYCHMTYDMESAEGGADIDVYFDEDGNGYQIMNING